MATASHALATDATLDEVAKDLSLQALTAAVQALPNATQAAADAANAAAAAATTAAASIAGIVAPTYSTTSTYKVGEYVYYNGHLYRCTTAITTGEAWTSGHWTQVSLSNDLLNLSYVNRGMLAAGSDLNDINYNSVYQVSNANTPTNAPVSNTPFIVLTNIFSGSTYRSQYVITFSSFEVYGRRMNSGTWGAWSRIPIMDNYHLTNSTSQIASSDDLDDIHDNSIRFVAVNAAPDNYPLGNMPGMVITSKCFSTRNTQMVIPYFYHTLEDMTIAQRNGYKICHRIYDGSSWTDWVYIKQTSRNDAGDYYAFGDSTTFGYSSDHSHAQSPWNYPAIVGDLTGVTVNNIADPAQGLIKDWSVGTEGNFAIIPTISQMISNGDFDNTVLITVGWAYNDSLYYSDLNFGDPTDAIPESTTGITTYLGYYAKILDILQKAAPQALVVLITGYGYTTNTEGHKADTQFTQTRTFADGNKTFKQIYDAMEEMANYNGFCCINQAKGCAINRANASDIIGDNIHPTYDNYRIYGNNIAARIAALFQNV